MKPSFEQVVGDYINLVYYIALKSVNQDQADDVVSDTFLKAFKAYENSKFLSHAQLKSWLLTICQNTIKDTYKVKQTLSLDEEMTANIEEELEGDKILDRIVRKDQISIVIDRLKKLNNNDQKIIRLRLFEDMSFKEIATIFSVAEPVVKMRFYRALESLRQSYHEN